jgi:hypothetical protein
MFIRFLLMAVSEKISPEQARADQERLIAFGRKGRPCVGKEKKSKPGRPAVKSLR